jgi:hypothetical protein
VSKLNAESRRNAQGARDGAIGAKTASAEMPKTTLSEEELRPPTTCTNHPLLRSNFGRL